MSFETPLPPYNVSDPYATFLNASCMDLLLIEMVPMTYRIANELSVPDEDGAKPIDEDEQRDAAFRRLETLGYRVGQGLAERCVACRFPLAQLGYEKFVVRLWQVEMATAVVARAMLTSNTSADRFSRDRPRFTDTLDVIKFLCKDLWTLVFRKQVDNLKTNHRVLISLLLPWDAYEKAYQNLLYRVSTFLQTTALNPSHA